MRGLASLNGVRNSEIAELLARAAEHAKQPLQRALRRAARRSFLWPEERAGIRISRSPTIPKASRLPAVLTKSSSRSKERRSPRSTSTCKELAICVMVQLGQCFSLVEHHPNKFAFCQPLVRARVRSTKRIRRKVSRHSAITRPSLQQTDGVRAAEILRALRAAAAKAQSYSHPSHRSRQSDRRIHPFVWRQSLLPLVLSGRAEHPCRPQCS